jgi:hypothetical protein
VQNLVFWGDTIVHQIQGQLCIFTSEGNQTIDYIDYIVYIIYDQTHRLLFGRHAGALATEPQRATDGVGTMIDSTTILRPSTRECCFNPITMQF